jgi:glucan phosphorylase
MIDVLAKRVATSKRQILYLFYIILRYIRIKENPKSQGNASRSYSISGRAPHSISKEKKLSKQYTK